MYISGLKVTSKFKLLLHSEFHFYSKFSSTNNFCTHYFPDMACLTVICLRLSKYPIQSFVLQAQGFHFRWQRKITAWIVLLLMFLFFFTVVSNWESKFMEFHWNWHGLLNFWYLDTPMVKKKHSSGVLESKTWSSFNMIPDQVWPVFLLCSPSHSHLHVGPLIPPLDTQAVNHPGQGHEVDHRGPPPLTHRLRQPGSGFPGLSPSLATPAHD